MGNAMRAQAVAQIPENIDMNRIYQIESSGNPQAYNARTKAAGLGQVTPVVLQEWNQRNPDDQHTPQELMQAPINTKISNWYANHRIPQMLNAYNIPDTVDNRLISYNAGIGTLLHKRPLPPETVNYIKVYKEKK